MVTAEQLYLPFEEDLDHEMRLLKWGCRSCDHFDERDFLSRFRGVDGYVLCQYGGAVRDLTVTFTCPKGPRQLELFT